MEARLRHRLRAWGRCIHFCPTGKDFDTLQKIYLTVTLISNSFYRFRTLDHFRPFGHHHHLPPPHHPLFSNASFKSLCSCCPPLSPSLKTPFHPFPLPLLSPGALGMNGAGGGSGGGEGSSPSTSIANTIGSLIDPRSSSVAELRRKAHEHSAALLQSFHQSLLASGPGANPFLFSLKKPNE